MADADGVMQQEIIGAGGATASHTATIYGLGSDGYYDDYAANEPVWRGARVVGGVAYGTDALGDPLADQPVIWTQPLFTNINTYTSCSGSGWTRLNVTVTRGTGVRGIPNTSDIIDDSSAVASGAVHNGLLGPWTIDTSSDVGSVLVFVKKESSDPGIYARYGLSLSGGTATDYRIIFNPFTGSAYESANPSLGEVIVVDDGEWWKLIITADNSGRNNDTAAFYRSIAASTDGTTENAGVAGQNIIENDGVQFFDNVPGSVLRHAGPIFTDGAAAATDATVYTFDGSNLSADGGALYVEILPTIADSEGSGTWEILSTTTGASLLYYDYASGEFRATDGTNTAAKAASLVALTAMKVGVVWDATEGALRINVDDSWGTAASYDGAFVGTDLHLGRAVAYPFGVRNGQLYIGGNYAGYESKIEELMA